MKNITLLALLALLPQLASAATTNCNTGVCSGVLRQGETLVVSPPNNWVFSGKGVCTFTVQGITSKVKGTLITVVSNQGTTPEWDCSDGVQAPGGYDMLNAGTFNFTFNKGVSSTGESCGKIDIEKGTVVPSSTLKYECKYLNYARR